MSRATALLLSLCFMPAHADQTTAAMACIEYSYALTAASKIMRFTYVGNGVMHKEYLGCDYKVYVAITNHTEYQRIIINMDAEKILSQRHIKKGMFL